MIGKHVIIRPWVALTVMALFVSVPISHAQTQVQAPASLTAGLPAKGFKTKIAIGRFSNETRYGKSLLVDDNLDPLGKQASDILSAYLTKTGQFVVLERPDLSKIVAEGERGNSTNVVGAETLIVGSVVEFGQSEDGKRGLLNKSRTERARAKVAVRLVDVRTGVSFHSVSGVGEATSETKTILGIGSGSRYNGTLADKALSVAVEAMLDELVNSLGQRPWRTDILAVKGHDIFITGGERQGLKPGAQLTILQAGETMRSAQTGFDIQLPPTKIADAQVVSTFGDSDINEGSIIRLTSGSLNGLDLKNLFVSAQ